MSVSNPVFTREGFAATWRGRATSFVAVITVGLAVAAFFAGRVDPARVKSFIGGGAMLMPLALARGFIAADIREGRWPVLFQNPVRPLHHYAAVFATTLGGCLLLLSAIAIAGMAGGAPANRELLGSLIGCWILAAVILATVVGVGSLVRRGEVEIVLLLLFVSMLQDVVTMSVGMPDAARDVVAWLLLPINPLGALIEVLAGTAQAGMTAGQWTQVAAYPAFWLGIAAWRLERYQSARASPL